MNQMQILKETFHLLGIRYEIKENVKNYVKKTGVDKTENGQEKSLEVRTRTANHTETAFIFDTEGKFLGMYGVS